MVASRPSDADAKAAANKVYLDGSYLGESIKEMLASAYKRGWYARKREEQEEKDGTP